MHGLCDLLDLEAWLGFTPSRWFRANCRFMWPTFMEAFRRKSLRLSLRFKAIPIWPTCRPRFRESCRVGPCPSHVRYNRSYRWTNYENTVVEEWKACGIFPAPFLFIHLKMEPYSGLALYRKCDTDLFTDRESKDCAYNPFRSAHGCIRLRERRPNAPQKFLNCQGNSACVRTPSPRIQP